MNRTLKICCIAMLSALSVVANFCTIPLPGNNAVSFTLAVCFFTGIYFGALPAALVGFVGDLIAHLIHPLGDYNWFLALSVTLYGVVCAIIYRLKMHRLLALCISVIICYIVCLYGLNSFGLWLQYCVGVRPSPLGLWDFFSGNYDGVTKTFWLYLAGRAPMSAVNIAVNAVIVAALQESRTIARLIARIREKKPVAESEQHSN